MIVFGTFYHFCRNISVFWAFQLHLHQLIKHHHTIATSASTTASAFGSVLVDKDKFVVAFKAAKCALWIDVTEDPVSQ